MRNNKILATAIATALPLSAGVILLGASSAFALDLVSHGTTATATGAIPAVGTSNTAPTFATQLFPGDINIASATGTVAYTATSCPANLNIPLDNSALVTRYQIPLAAVGIAEFTAGGIVKVTATLSGSAGWATSPGFNPTGNVVFCNGATDIVTSGALITCGATLATISKSSIVTDKGASSVEFAVQAVPVGNGATIKEASAFLFFCPDVDADFLSTAGSSLTLTMSGKATLGNQELPMGSAETVTIASSVQGINLYIDEGTSVTPTPANPAQPAQAAISFNADALKFAVGATKTNMTDVDRVSLGRILIRGADGAKDRNGSSAYIPATASWSGKLTITDGPFSASTGPNQVFLDNDGNCQFDTATVPPSVAANSVTNNKAEWTLLNGIQLTALYQPAGTGMHVCVIADGVKTIEEQAKAPSATLQMGATGQTATVYPPGRLRHLKENGTKCTLYNVPDGTETGTTLSTDVVSVRITNTSKNPGRLFATLYDQSGKPLYTPNKRVSLGDIAPYQTLRYYTGQENMDGYSVDKDLTTLGIVGHWVGQRATLIIASDLNEEDISIFGLVRNRHGGPNMNMSTGATGNGCD
jgi:hypothetical protein